MTIIKSLRNTLMSYVRKSSDFLELFDSAIINDETNKNASAFVVTAPENHE